MAAPAHIARANGKKGGRPKGSTTKPQLRDHLTEAQIASLVAKAEEKAHEGDSRLIIFLLEQVYGKAPQSITGGDGGPIEVTVLKYAK